MRRLLAGAIVASLSLLPVICNAGQAAVPTATAPTSVHDVPVGARKFLFQRFDRKTASGVEHYFVVLENGRQLHSGTAAELRRLPDPALNFALSGVLSQIAVPHRGTSGTGRL